MRVATFPTLYVEGWDGSDDPSLLPYCEVLNVEGFLAPQPTDRMAVGYVVPEEVAWPRLGRAALAPLQAQGQEPLLVLAILDLDRPGHTPWPGPGVALEALAALEGAWEGPPWSGAYSTPRGARLLWRLQPPLPASLANGWLRGLLDRVAPVARTVGLEADPTSCEWTRLFRLPRARRDGVVLDPPEAYLDSEVTLDPYRWPGDPLTVEAAPRATRHEEAPPEGVVLTLDDWRAAWRYPWLRVGRSFRPDADGHVYPVVRRVLAAVAAAGRVIDPAVLYAYVADSVAATPGLSEGEVWRVACWVADQEAARVPEPDPDPEVLPTPERPTPEAWEAIRPAFRGHLAASFGRLRDGMPLTAQKARLPEKTYEVVRHLVERARVHQPEGVYALVAASVARSLPHGPTLEEVWEACIRACHEVVFGNDNDARRRIFVEEYPLTIKPVGRGGRIFQLDTTVVPYVYRLSDEDSLRLHFRRWTAPGLPFEADYDGLGLPEVLDRYGATVEATTYVSGQRGTVYDPLRATLQVGVHEILATRAEYHADVDGWLRVLGGTAQEELLDWLSAVTYTAEEPIAALYLEGGPGAGKSLLISGIASLWGCPAADYNQVTGAFHGGVLLSPVLAADEGIVVGPWDECRASEVFRNYVANLNHTINAKYLPPATLHGAFRVIVTGNDGDAIPFGRALGQEGVDAIVARVLKIPQATPRGAPRAYLDALGGRRGVRDWVGPGCTPGKMAEHLLWLREHRELVRGSRFLVEGRPTDWHRRWAAAQGHKPAVLGVVARLIGLLRVGAAVGAAWVRVDAEHQRVWVAPQAVSENWGRSKALDAGTVLDTLRQLAGEEARRQVRFGSDRKWCWGVPFRAFVDARVLEWSDLGVDEPEVGNEGQER